MTFKQAKTYIYINAKKTESRADLDLLSSNSDMEVP
jgi:hypothetical protein